MPSSPRRRIRFASVADGLKDCSDPVGSTHLRRLDTSNGCQDHTVLPYAAHRLRHEGFAGALTVRRSFSEGGAPVVCALCSLTGDKPALRTPHAPDAAASTATRPSFVTMANAPLGGTGCGRCRGDLGVASSKISVNRKLRLSERWHHVDAVVELDGTRRANSSSLTGVNDRQAHNLKVIGSNPIPATKISK
jgi:hypothetical protein